MACADCGCYEVDPERVRTEERMAYVGAGQGSYQQVSKIQMVGAGKGDFEKEQYASWPLKKRLKSHARGWIWMDLG